MGIANRDKDASEQNYIIKVSQNALVATGVTLYADLVPTPGQILEFKVTANGISGAPTYQPEIHRMVVGSGLTVIALGSAVAALAFGTSGSAGATYASNSSLAAVQAGDLLVVKSAGSNAAALQVIASFVIKATQDIKKSFDI